MSQSTIIAFAILCLTLRVSAITTSSKSYDLPGDHQIVSDEWSVDGNKMAFASCNGVDSKTETNCTVFLKTLDSEAKDKEAVCHITLKLSNHKSQNDLSSVIIPGTNDKAIFLPSFSKNEAGLETLRIIIINFSNCQTSDTELSLPDSLGHLHPDEIGVLTYENTFDIIYTHRSERFQDTEENYLYKVTVDADGKQLTKSIRTVAGPAKFFKSVASHSQAKGYVALGFTELDVDARYYESDVSDFQTPKEKIEIMKNPAFDKDYSLAFSMAHENVGLCLVNMKLANFTCSQYNSRRKFKLEAKFKVDHELHSRSTMYNLPNGGFLLLTKGCERDNPCQRLTKVSADGKPSKSLLIEFPKCENYEEAEPILFAKNDEDYSLTKMCLPKKNTGDESARRQLNVTVKKLTNKDF